jgi:hypothetical protein
LLALWMAARVFFTVAASISHDMSWREFMAVEL